MEQDKPAKPSLAMPVRAFRIDGSWYEAYWYGEVSSRPRLLTRALPAATLAIAVLFAAGLIG